MPEYLDLISKTIESLCEIGKPGDGFAFKPHEVTIIEGNKVMTISIGAIAASITKLE